MLPIEIYYREPLTFRLWKRKFAAQLPQSWNEAGASFWIAFSRYLLDAKVDNKRNAVYEFMHDCLPFPKRILKSLNKAIANDIIAALPFLSEKINSHKVAVPEIKITKTELWFFGEEQFHSMTVAQFVLCERIQRIYASTKNVDLLNEMVATLYRAKGSDQLVPEFNARENQLRIPLVAKHVDESVKKAVLLNFIAMMNYLQEHPKLKTLFPKKDDTMTLASLTQPTKASEWSKLIHQMSGPQLGTANEVEKLPTFYFLNRLAERAKEAKQNKSKK
jgi:hypothetical protein